MSPTTFCLLCVSLTCARASLYYLDDGFGQSVAHGVGDWELKTLGMDILDALGLKTPKRRRFQR